MPGPDEQNSIGVSPLQQPEATRTALKKGLFSALFTLVGVGLVILAISRTETGGASLDSLLHSARPLEILLAWCLISLAFVCMAFRWRALMPPSTQPPIPGLTAIICGGLLLNYAIPGPMGELAAAWFAHRRYAVPVASALASGIAARLVGLATAAGLATLIWATSDLPVPPGYEEAVGLLAVSVGVGGLLLGSLAARPSLWKGLTARVLAPFRGFRRLGRVIPRVQGGVDALADALAETALRGPAAYARTVGWALLGHCTVTLGILVGIDGLGATADLAGVAFTYTLSTAGAVLLFLFPGSQAGWDAMFVSLLVGTAGLGWPAALSVGLLVRLQQLFFMVVGGLALLWLRGPAHPAPAARDRPGS